MRPRPLTITDRALARQYVARTREECADDATREVYDLLAGLARRVVIGKVVKPGGKA
jgi:hypothetical protein